MAVAAMTCQRSLHSAPAAHHSAAPTYLLLDDLAVDLARGDVVVARQGDVEVALVVAEVEVGLAAVVEHVHLAVLRRRHGAGVDVHVGVDLDGGDLEAEHLEQQARRRGWARGRVPVRQSSVSGETASLQHGRRTNDALADARDDAA
jgi:hypothetical protein